MKKFYTFLVLAFTVVVGNAQIANIPDANFKAKLLASSASAPIAYGSSGARMKIDGNNDGNIQVSEALLVYQLYISSSNIADLTGIESFTNLRTFVCSSNQVSTLNLIPFVHLTSLTCGGNPLMTINVAPIVTLQTLSCNSNQLTSLNVSSNTNLQTLSCTDNTLTNLDLTNCTGLTSVNCANNQLTSLNVSTNANLTSLTCSGNLLTNLNTTNCVALTYIDCSTNQLTTLDVSNKPNLSTFYCAANLLTSINMANDLAIIDLNYGWNQIQAINLDPFINIETLLLGNNPYTSPVNLSTLVNLTWLDVQNISNPAVCPLTDSVMPSLVNLATLKTDGSAFGNINYNLIPNLNFLLCRNTGLTSLNTMPLAISQLVTEANLLTTVDLTPFTNLTVFQSYNNPITSVVLGSHPGLFYLSLGKSQLTSLDVSGFPALSYLGMDSCPLLTSCNVKNGLLTNFGFVNCPSLLYICADDAAINNIQTAITTNAASYNGNPNCHVNSYCTFEPGGTFYTIQGNHRWDTTNNGCDASDFLFSNMKFNISNGTNTTTLISGADGSYHYDVPTGTYTVTHVLENPSYFSVTPSSTGSIVFPTATSPYIRDFCVRSLANNPDLEVSMLPEIRPRPGFNSNLIITFKNKGGIPQNGTVGLSFNDNLMNSISAVPTISSSGTNSLSWNFSNLLPFETRTIIVRFHFSAPTDTPPLNSGDVVSFTTIISSILTDLTPIDNTFTLNQIVLNSYDPNDKTCLEGNTITPSMVGQYLHYVIRFENTGTANAQNVVVSDTIDLTKFNIATLIPQSSSHSFTTRINNTTGKVEFIFENINLPFDDANNDGYVAFKIKTKSTLVVGNTFSNTANIYFDYNAPIVTNTATTTIATLGTQDFEFGSVFTLSPVPAKDNLTFTTKQDVVMSSVSIYNTLGQLVQVNTNPSETIDVSGLKTGSYFIKIVSDKGTASGKFLKE